MAVSQKAKISIMSKNYAYESPYLHSVSPAAVEVWCGIPALGELVRSGINKQDISLLQSVLIKLIVDVPQGFALELMGTLAPHDRRNWYLMAVTFSSCAEYWEDLWDLRPEGLVVVTDHSFDIASSIRRAARGENCRVTPNRTSALNRSERQLLNFVARGFTNKAIGQQLGLQEKTIMNSLTTIYNKLNVRSRTQAILYYWGLQCKPADPPDSSAELAWTSPSVQRLDENSLRDIYPSVTGYSSLTND